MRKYLLSILVIMITLSSRAETTCTLSGEVFNRDSKFVFLRKNSESAKVYSENPTKIKIKNGKFHYTFSYNEVEAYELVFDDELKTGSWRSIVFFPDSDTVRFKLFPKPEWTKNIITGGDLNRGYAEFLLKNSTMFDKRSLELLNRLNILRDSDELHTPEYMELLRQLREYKSDYDAQIPIHQKKGEMEKTRSQYTDKAMKLFVEPYDSLLKSELVWKYNYIKTHISLVSYYLLWHDVVMTMNTNAQVAQMVMTVFPNFEKKYPEHIYTKKISTQLAGIKSIVVGSKYIDFKAPTIEGDTVSLSAVANKPITLIDFWGSWCGPCIAKSRLVVPVYEKYKDKGFEVVGIAREFKSTDAMRKRLAKEQFSWLHLVELDDKQNIWNLYGISNGTGLMVVINEDGVILSIDPSPEELEKILLENL